MEMLQAIKQKRQICLHFKLNFHYPILFSVSLLSPLPSLLLSLKLEIETHMELERKVQSKSACKDFVRPIFSLLLDFILK